MSGLFERGLPADGDAPAHELLGGVTLAELEELRDAFEPTPRLFRPYPEQTPLGGLTDDELASLAEVEQMGTRPGAPLLDDRQLGGVTPEELESLNAAKAESPTAPPGGER